MLPSYKLAWLLFWIFPVAFALDAAVKFNNWLDDVPSKVTGKIGDDLKIECTLPNYKLTFFAWKLCESDCPSLTAVWEMVVKVDYGNITIFNRTKFALTSNGSLILKDIQPSNDHNWVRCLYKEPYVSLDHRSTIIFVLQEPVITSDDPKEYEVIENMPFVMVCEVKEGYPPPWVAWIWKDQVVQNKTNGPTYLRRPRTTAEEAGIYTCKAGNTAGVTSFDIQLTVRVDFPPRVSTAAPETHSTVQRPTAESKLSSEEPSVDSARKANQKSISLGLGIVIGIGIGIVIGIVAVGFALATVRCVKRKWKNKSRVAAMQLQENSTNADNL